MGNRGKGKEMKGFFAVEQALFPTAARVLVQEAKLLLLLFLWSYRESYETALLEKEETVQIPVWFYSKLLSSFYVGLPNSLWLVKYLTQSRCSKMSVKWMRKCCSPMGSAHVEPNQMGRGDKSLQHLRQGAGRPTSTGRSGSSVCVCVCVYNLLTNISNNALFGWRLWNREESFNQISLSLLNGISYLVLYLFW